MLVELREEGENYSIFNNIHRKKNENELRRRENENTNDHNKSMHIWEEDHKNILMISAALLLACFKYVHSCHGVFPGVIVKICIYVFITKKFMNET